MRNLLLIVTLVMFTQVGYGQEDPLVAPLCHAWIGDTVWHDMDKDGIQDIGEPGIENVEIKLYKYNPSNGSSQYLDTKWSNPDGSYKFWVDSNNKWYYLTFEYDASWTQCPCDMGGDPAKDSNLRHTSVTTMGVTDTFKMSGHQVHNYTIDGGLFEFVLPLDILDFNVVNRGNSNMITWSIANVFNEEFMVLERSYGDQPFTEITRYEDLAAGDYSFTDYNNARVAGPVYYRLAIINYEGETTYSQVIKTVTVRQDEELLSIYPNPVQDMVTVAINLDGVKINGLTITDMTGRMVQQLPFNNQSVTINFRDRVDHNGMYIMGVMLSDGQVIYKRILLTR